MFLKKHLRNQQRGVIEKAFLSLSKARKLGILTDFRDTRNRPAVIEFYKRVRKEGVLCKVLIFVDEKRAELNQYDYDKLFPGAQVMLICPEDLNYWEVAKKSRIQAFISESFDILFRLCLDKQFDLDVILLQSKAKMLTGQSHPELSFLDFTIDVKPGADLSFLTSNLILYLEKLETSKESPNYGQSNKLF